MGGARNTHARRAGRLLSLGWALGLFAALEAAGWLGGWPGSTAEAQSIPEAEAEAEAEGDQPAARDPSAAATAGEEGPESTYRSLIAAALEEFDGGRWAEARALFRRAHRLDPNARTLRGIAMTSFELREYAAAIRAIDAALDHPRRPLTSAQRQHVRDLRARAEAFVARYELRLSPGEARVLVDGVLQDAPHAAELVVDLGLHSLRIEAEGHRPHERRVHVVGGERGTLDVHLEPRAAAASAGEASGAAAPEAARPAPSGDPGPEPDPTVAHALLVSSAAALALTAAGLGYWIDRETTVRTCDFEICSNEDALRTERDVAAGLTLIAAGAFTALAIGGAVLLLSAPKDGSSAHAACAPSPMGALCFGRF